MINKIGTKLKIVIFGHIESKIIEKNIIELKKRYKKQIYLIFN